MKPLQIRVEDTVYMGGIHTPLTYRSVPTPYYKDVTPTLSRWTPSLARAPAYITKFVNRGGY